jgi:colanic acid/amylovoran biosynthesis protein
MRRKNGFYILMPQAFGPFKTQHQKRKIRDLVNAATVVFARDAQSRLYLEQAGVDLSKVRVSPDFTASVPPLETAIPGGDYACIVPNVKLISRMNENAASKKGYIDLLVKCIDRFRERDIQPVLLYHHTQDDNTIYKRVAPELDDDILLIDETDPRKLKFILGRAQVNICSRYHACISSLSQGVPALATSWSHKYEMLYQEYGAPELVVDNSSAASSAIDHVLTSQEALSSILIEKTGKIKMKIDAMWDMVSELMNR